jgi:hypothetical protein
LKDVTFGFKMAELHGMALAPAPHYSLEHFHSFDRVMTHVDVPTCGQYIYNSGVIFMCRRPDVIEVFQSWKKMGYHLSDETGYKRADQPYLSLAIEKLQFNPYTLPPTYNYRAKVGEPICGEVFIWHRDQFAPPDINIYTEVWPPHGYIGLRRFDNLRKTLKQLQAKKKGSLYLRLIRRLRK